MKHRNQMKRTYRSPLSTPTEVEFEQSLLVGSIQNTTELVNMGIDVQYYDLSPESEEYEIEWY